MQALAERLLYLAGKHLGAEGLGEVRVPLEEGEEVGLDVPQGRGRPALPQEAMNQMAQPVAAGVVLHPARLECCVLPVVGEHQELLLPLCHRVHHVLSQDVDVRHGDRAERLQGLDDSLADLPTLLGAGGTGEHLAPGRPAQDRDGNQRLTATTLGVGAGRPLFAVDGAAVPAER